MHPPGFGGGGFGGRGSVVEHADLAFAPKGTPDLDSETSGKEELNILSIFWDRYFHGGHVEVPGNHLIKVGNDIAVVFQLSATQKTSFLEDRGMRALLSVSLNSLLFLGIVLVEFGRPMSHLATGGVLQLLHCSTEERRASHPSSVRCYSAHLHIVFTSLPRSLRFLSVVFSSVDGSFVRFYGRFRSATVRAAGFTLGPSRRVHLSAVVRRRRSFAQCSGRPRSSERCPVYSPAGLPRPKPCRKIETAPCEYRFQQQRIGA